MKYILMSYDIHMCSWHITIYTNNSTQMEVYTMSVLNILSLYEGQITFHANCVVLASKIDMMCPMHSIKNVKIYCDQKLISIEL